MELYILDTNYYVVGSISEADSVLWNKKFNDEGESEIYIQCTNDTIDLLRKGYYVYRYDDDMLCKIETVELTTNVENGDYLIATAKDICTILSGRVVMQLVYSGNVAGFIQKLLTVNVINPSATNRKISNLYVDTSNFSEFTQDYIDVTANTDDLLQLVISTCKAYNIGFRLSLDIDTRRLRFRLYKGDDKSTTQSNEYVEFSPAFSNILSSSYKEDDSAYKNVAYVGYKTVEEDFRMLMVAEGTEATGESRRELYVDGTGTSRSITPEELQLMYNVVVRNPATGGDSGYYYTMIGGSPVTVATFEGSTSEGVYSEKTTVTDYTYLVLIRTLGKKALAENVKTKSFSGEVDTIDTYEYKTDYNIGDIVKVINEYGISAPARITEVMESEDSDNGYQIEPKFEFNN